jgi:hypothetical protein
MNVKFEVGDFAVLKDMKYAREWNRVGQKVEIVGVNVDEFDLRIKFEDDTTDLYQDYELDRIDETQETEVINHLIVNTPTFNISELPYGSLIYVNKRYIQLQGFVADINPKILTLGYYDADEYGSKCSHETVDIERVVTGEYTVELIRKAIPLELQGV